MSTVAPSYTMAVLPQHQRLLAESGIDPAVAYERGYRTADTKSLMAGHGFADYQRNVPALVIPLHNVHGEQYGVQARPDYPREKQGKEVKYETPDDQEQHLDVHPRSVRDLGNPGYPLVITEGARKADAAVSRGMVAISLNGVYAWRGKNEDGGLVALPDWESVALNDREVFVCFDSDVMTKPQVRKARDRLARFLGSRGAQVSAVLLPAPDGRKVGLDDFLAEDETRDLNSLRGLVVMDNGPARTQGRVLARSELSNVPAPEPFVRGVLSRRAAVVMVGPTGVGKSVLATAWACAAASGVRWLDREVIGCSVLYVVGEGVTGMDGRITAWEKAWHKGESVPDENLHIMVKPGSLLGTNEWEDLTARAIELDARFVVLDTMSSLFPDADETRDAAKITRKISDLAEAIDGTVLLVHHPGWSDASRVRGGYQFEANADEVITLAGAGAGEDLICLKRKKVKEGASGDTLWLRRKPSNGSVIIEEARPQDVEVPMQQRILTVLAAMGDQPSTGKQIRDEIGVSDSGRSAFFKALKRLVEDGTLAQAGAGRGRDTYMLTTGESSREVDSRGGLATIPSPLTKGAESTPVHPESTPVRRASPPPVHCTSTRASRVHSTPPL